MIALDTNHGVLINQEGEREGGCIFSCHCRAREVNPLMLRIIYSRYGIIMFAFGFE